MPLVTYVEHDGTAHPLDVPVGDSVMQGAVNNGLDAIVAECGGGLACATCHVYVDDAWIDRLDPPSAAEKDMLEATASPRGPGSRLSCQINVDARVDGLIVRLPEAQY